LSETTEINYLLTVNADLTYSELQKIETMLTSLASRLRRLTGNENIDKFIAKVQEAINYVRALQVAVTAFMAAAVPGAGWVKAAWVGFAAANAAFAGYDMLRGY